MVDASPAETPSAASPAADEAVREAEMLSGLTRLALEMARAFQARGVAALAAGDLDGAGKAEAGFSRLFLAIRRAVALRAKLRRQRQEEPDEADAAMLSELMALAQGLAQIVQADGIAALAADDLDRAGAAEARFNSLFLGIRRAIALQAKLRQQREEARREAEIGRKHRQDEKNERRQAVAQGVARAIAAAPGIDADGKAEMTVDLWERLTEDERIDIDLADTALPIGALIASLCRALGLPPRGTPPAGGPAVGGPASSDPAAAAQGGAGAKGQAAGPASRRAASGHDRDIPVEGAVGPEGEHHRRSVPSGGISRQDRDLVPAPARDVRPSAGTGPPGTAPPAMGPRRETGRRAQGLTRIHQHG